MKNEQKNKKKFNQIEYNNQYNKNNYDRISLILPKGEKEKIKTLSKEQGISVNAFIQKAIRVYIDDLNYF